MENPAERSKFDVDSSEKICYFDTLPDGVLEKIIGYVPNKDDCFLVNKRFQKESINAMRNRYRLVLDDCNIKELKEINSVLKTGRKFDEIWIHCDYRFTMSYFILQKCKELIRHFGSSIKTFNINVASIDDGDFMEMLGLMKSLKQLKYGIGWTSSNVSAQTVQLNHLEILTLKPFKESLSFLDSLSCPALQELNIETLDDDPGFFDPVLASFIRRHSQIKHLNFETQSLKTIQSIITNEGLKLTSLKIENFSESSYNTAMATAFNSALCEQKDLEVLNVIIKLSVVNGEVPQAISTLPMLKTLYMHLHESPSEEHIYHIIQMNNLKRFECGIYNLEYLNPLASTPNLRFEELALHLLHDDQEPMAQREYLRAIANNLRNLNKAKFCCRFDIGAILNFASISQNLEYLNIFGREYFPMDTSLDWSYDPTQLLANHRIRKLHLDWRFISLKDVEACLKIMPNVETLNLRNSSVYDAHGTEGLIRILNLQHLTEFGSDAKYLEQPEVISTIMEHGKKLKKIIAYKDYPFENFGHVFSAFPAYSSQFPIKRHGWKRDQDILMMRA